MGPATLQRCGGWQPFPALAFWTMDLSARCYQSTVSRSGPGRGRARCGRYSTRDDWRVCRVSCLAGTDIRTSRSLHVDGRPEMNADAKMKSEMREKRAMGIQGSRFSTFDLQEGPRAAGAAVAAAVAAAAAAAAAARAPAAVTMAKAVGRTRRPSVAIESRATSRCPRAPASKVRVYIRIHTRARVHGGRGAPASGTSTGRVFEEPRSDRGPDRVRQ